MSSRHSPPTAAQCWWHALSLDFPCPPISSCFHLPTPYPYFSPSSSLPCGLDCFSPLLLISIIEFCTESSMSCIELIFSSSLSTLSDCSFFHSFCDSRAMIIAGSSGSFASSAAVLAISSLCDLSIGICAAVSSSRPPLNYLYLCCPPPVQTPGFPSPRMVRFVHLPLCSPPCTRD